MCARGVRISVWKAGGLVVGFGSLLQAAEVGWNKDADGAWTVAANWTPSTVPGAADTALFSFPLTGGRTVTVDAGRGISTIAFGNPQAFGYTLTGGGLLLADGGVIKTLADNGPHVDTVASPVLIQGDGAAVTFSGEAASVESPLRVSGAVAGVSGAGMTTTLTLTGALDNLATNAISGAIGDGGGGGRLAVVKSGITNLWVLSGANTFSGGVSIKGGALVAAHDQALGGGGLTQDPGAGLALQGGVTVTGKSLTTGGSTPSTLGSLDNFGGTNVWAGNITFAGSGPRVNCANGKLIITGDVYVNSASGNPTIGGYGEGEIRGVISGNSAKTFFRSSTDTGSWALLNTNTFAGNVTCANGSVIVNNDKSLGARTTFAAAGLTLGGSATRGTLRAIADVTLSDKYGVTLHGGGGRFDVDEGMALTVNGVIVNRAANPQGTLYKTGSGTLVLAAANTFSNLLDVAEGTVRLANGAALKGFDGSKPTARVNVDGVLDLGGSALTLPVLSGAGGAVSNGTLAVLTAIQLGGDGRTEPFALPATAFSGALTVDVTETGACDTLEVAGDLVLHDVSLTIANPAALRASKTYTLIHCTGGTVAGSFTDDNLPDNWHVQSDGTRLALAYFAGMIMTVR
ncbi:MAG TPA: autotransporter-associated beta strand repeat-containing protein [Kiritimatiellia bacterium]|nr:MAG: Autotransporter-associated beta strand repeat protein [Verrucomicrobia bacterium ADurb.Bin070]HQL49620.1 autotransporter-associated beta strand repeat-containing protein [Kiritimatiellia bacterium]HQQ91817.1 autotransporter-associated beta strand repeat-containing protein [Kiritimatiellia bacterium]